MASKTDRLLDELDADGIVADAALEVLADSRYRTVLDRLVREEDPTNLSELTASLCPETDESSDRIASQLHHVVLPKLDDVGLVTYDWRENVAELDASARRVRTALDRTLGAARQ